MLVERILQTLLISLVASLVAGIGPLWAQQPEPSADATPQALAGEPQTSGTPSSNSGNPARLHYTEQLDNYHQAIAEIEAKHGAWGNALAEQLSGLGRLYQQRGQHREAIAVFERAMHVARINSGLYSLSQVPIVESLVDSLVARGEWDKVHDRHQYLYWLHERSYGADDPRMLPVIDKLGQSYINDYAMNPGARDPALLMDAHQLYSNATRIVREKYGENDLRMAEPLRGLAMSSWFFAEYSVNVTSQLKKQRLSREIGPELNTAQYHAIASSQTSIRSGVYYNDAELPPRLMRHLRTSYTDGREALSRLVDVYANNPEAPPGAAAEARIELGDWQLLFDKYHSAKTHYLQAYKSLAADPDTQPLLRKFFQQPVALPAMALVETDLDRDALQKARAPADSQQTAPEQPAPGGANEPFEYVLVKFDVDPYGEVRNIRIIESQPRDATGKRVRVKQTLENLRFRPRVVDGELVSTEDLTQKYVFTQR